MTGFTRLLISTNPTSLLTQLNFENASLELIASLRLLISSNSENVVFRKSGFDIPWSELKSILPSLVEMLKSENVEFSLDSFTNTLVTKLIHDKNFQHSESPNISIDDAELIKDLKEIGFSRILTDQQIRDVRRLLFLKHGANFSVPGAGKTTSLLAVHSILKKQKIVDCLFVISPINAFISWEDEIKEIFLDKSFKIIRLSKKEINNYQAIEKSNPSAILVNYEKLRNDISPLVPIFHKRKIHLVLDESHKIKGGSNNLSFNQIIKISDLAIRKDILSGTPLPQSPYDLDPQFNFLWNMNLKNVIQTMNNDDQIIKTLNSKIKNLYVRTTKSELGLKPPKIIYRPIRMGVVQSELYRLVRSEAARKIAKLDRVSLLNYRDLGKNIVRLLQIASNPMLLGADDIYYKEIIPIPSGSEIWFLLKEFSKYEKPAKIDYLLNRVNTLLSKDPSIKIVIWSYFVRNILLMERLLAKYNPVTIFGGVPIGLDEDERNRESRIRKFHDDKNCRVMIANPQAGGEGISLHRVCHYAIYLDQSFNAAHFLQSMDRIHRLGLRKTQNTYIEILQCVNTIDEVVSQRLNLKLNVMSQILNDPHINLLVYNPEDIDEELGLDSDDFDAIKKHLLENEAI